MKRKYLIAISAIIVVISCKKNEDNSTPIPSDKNTQLVIGLEFDETLPRLGNFGEPVDVPTGNASQHPSINEVSLHYIEFSKDSLTALGDGNIVYQGEETTLGGDKAVYIDQAIFKGDQETYTSVDLSSLSPGTYNWIRVSLTYQNYDIQYRLNVLPLIINQDYTGTLSSFVGYNNYITTHKVKDSILNINSNKIQGFWAFETGIEVSGQTYGGLSKGDGAGVTVVNPISATSPIPLGSCVVTGKLKAPLVITGDEESDVEVILAFSINNSFEWVDLIPDGKFEPGAGETVADMGLRGLHPYMK